MQLNIPIPVGNPPPTTLNKICNKSCNQFTYKNNIASLWTPELDNLLKEAVEQYGSNWISISNYLSDRLGCRTDSLSNNPTSSAVNQQVCSSTTGSGSSSDSISRHAYNMNTSTTIPISTTSSGQSVSALPVVSTEDTAALSAVDNTVYTAAAGEGASASVHVGKTGSYLPATTAAAVKPISWTTISDTVTNITASTAAKVNTSLHSSPNNDQLVYKIPDGMATSPSAPAIIPLDSLKTTISPCTTTTSTTTGTITAIATTTTTAATAGLCNNIKFLPTALECSQRWATSVCPAVQQQFPPWTEEEVNTLITLVTQQQQADQARGGHGTKVNWTTVALLLNRTAQDVSRQYNTLHSASLRHGNFTPTEDNIIIQRYIQWQQLQPQKSGLWVALEKELNRKDKRISERWRHVLSKRFNIKNGRIDLNNMYSDVYYNGKYRKHTHNNDSNDSSNSVDGLTSWTHTNTTKSNSTNTHSTDSETIQATGQNITGDLTDCLAGEHWGNPEQQSSSMRTTTNACGIGKRKRGSTTTELGSRPYQVLYQGIIRWDDALDARLREAVSLYPRDWVRISMHVGVEANGSKCRKRWARLREKYRKSVEGGMGFDRHQSFPFDLDGDLDEGGEGVGDLDRFGDFCAEGIGINDVEDEEEEGEG